MKVRLNEDWIQYKRGEIIDLVEQWAHTLVEERGVAEYVKTEELPKLGVEEIPSSPPLEEKKEIKLKTSKKPKFDRPRLHSVVHRKKMKEE